MTDAEGRVAIARLVYEMHERLIADAERDLELVEAERATASDVSPDPAGPRASRQRSVER